MSGRQRMGFLALAALVLIVAVIALRPQDDDERDRTAAPGSTASPAASASRDDPGSTAGATPVPTPDPGPLLTAGKVTRIEVSKGDRVRFRVRSEEADELHVHGYDVSEDLEPGQTTQVSFGATIEGIFEIEFEGSGTQVGELRVEP